MGELSNVSGGHPPLLAGRNRAVVARLNKGEDDDRQRLGAPGLDGVDTLGEPFGCVSVHGSLAVVSAPDLPYVRGNLLPNCYLSGQSSCKRFHRNNENQIDSYGM